MSRRSHFFIAPASADAAGATAGGESAVKRPHTLGDPGNNNDVKEKAALAVQVARVAPKAPAASASRERQSWCVWRSDTDGAELAKAPASRNVSAPIGASESEWARAIAEALEELGYAGGGVTLTLPTDWCLTGKVALDGTRRNRAARQVLRYRLEVKLPLSAEDIVADYLWPGVIDLTATRSSHKHDVRNDQSHLDPARAQSSPLTPPSTDRAPRDVQPFRFTASPAQVALTNEVMGVAIELGRLRPLVDALESAGISVETVTPHALLRLQAIVASGLATDRDPASKGQPVAANHVSDDTSAGVDVILLGDGDFAEIFSVSSRGIEDWQRCSTSPSHLLPRLQVLALRRGGPLTIGVRGLQEEVRDDLAAVDSFQVIDLSPASAEASSVSAADFISGGGEGGGGEPWINLRRDELAPSDSIRQIRPAINAALWAACLFFAVLSGAFLVRAAMYENLAGKHRDEQAALYRQAFPGQAIPAGIRSRLESEERRYRGLSGDPQTESSRPEALSPLHALMSRLPLNQVRFRVNELRVTGDRIYLTGQARAHGDADMIAASLRKAGAFDVDAPRTDSLDARGVEFTITGQSAHPLQSRTAGRTP